MKNISNNTSSYLPHIDGLRAIAIVAVILFHTGLGILPSGFIGVDIFFVISGFLITRLLVSKINQGNFSYRDFYLRRFRRLIPAYLAVAVATLIVGFFILLPDDLEAHSKITFLAFISLSNFYLANTTGGYFAPDTDEVPMLHTWSLSVEEQYYLIWPFILFTLLTRLKFKNSLVIFIGLLIISIGLSEYLIQNSPAKSYYLLPARIYELLTGALLALVIHRLPLIPRIYSSLLSFASLATLVYASMHTFSGTGFPGLNGVSISLATAILIYTGLSANIFTQVLSSAPFVAVGKISYSLYLWHWPIYAFIHYYYGELRFENIILGTLLAIILSILTWIFIETPFRKYKTYNFKTTFKFMYLMPAIILVITFIIIKNEDGLIDRFADKKDIIQALKVRGTMYQESCKDINSTSCKEILLAGDSHAQHFGGFVHQFTKLDGNIALKTSMKTGCLPLIDLTPATRIEGIDKPEIDKECYKKNHALFNNLNDEQYKYILLAADWSSHEIKQGEIFYFDTNDSTLSGSNSLKSIENSFVKTIDLIVEKNIIPIIIKDTPTIEKSVYKCSIRKLVYSYEGNCHTPRSLITTQQASIENIFSKLKKNYPEIIFIDPNKIVCPDNLCLSELNGLPLYRDDDHLNAKASALIGKLYIQQFGTVF